MISDKKLFSEMLAEAVKNFPERPALTCGQQTLTFAQLKDAVDAAAAKLIRAGVKKGDMVVIWSVNSIEWAIAFYAVTQTGGIAALMNYGLKAPDITALTKMVGAKWCIIGGNSISISDPAGAAKAAIGGGVPQACIFPMTEFAYNEEAALLEEERKMVEAAAAAVDPKETQLIIYTTGTTSAPKAVQLSSYSVISNAEGSVMLLGEDIADSICLALPLFHSYGLMVQQVYLMCGKQVFLSPILKPDTLLELITAYSVKDICSVGAIYGMLTRLPEFEKALSGKMNICIVGGGFTTPVEMMRLEKAFGGAKLICGYGQTECSPVITVEKYSDPLEKRAVSVGHSLPNHEVRIWNDKNGFAPTGEVGEIVVKGPSLMNGYLGLPAEKQAIDKDGWLHTGDLGRFDEGGMLQFAGRIKDIIIRSGENVSPVEIEKALLAESDIREAKVLGAPHPIWGESIEACVVLNQAVLDEDDLRLRLKKKLSSLKIPTHFFVYDRFPLNENGKLDQRRLKADMLNRLYAISIAEAVDEGLRILDLRLKNRSYSIVPACSMIQQLTEQLGFERSRSERIRLSVEEMLTDRIDNAYDENGEIRMEVVLMSQWLRLKFTDTGKEYRLDSEDASISAKIILANVDYYTSGKNDAEETEYCLDYQYTEDFDVKAYLMHYRAR